MCLFLTMLLAAEEDVIFGIIYPIWHYCFSEMIHKPEKEKPKTQSEMQAGKRLETLLKQIAPNNPKAK